MNVSLSDFGIQCIIDLYVLNNMNRIFVAVYSIIKYFANWSNKLMTNTCFLLVTRECYIDQGILFSLVNNLTKEGTNIAVDFFVRTASICNNIHVSYEHFRWMWENYDLIL